MKYDDFVKEQEDNGIAHWVVELNSGEEIYQDDNRPGLLIPAWIRLAEYVKQKKDKIKKLWLKFRSNEVKCLPESCEGYYFCKSSGCTINGPTFDFYLIGHIVNNEAYIQTYKVPELLFFSREKRLIIKNNPCVILNE